MVVTDGFVLHCIELLGALGPVRSRRMFGGHGFYVDDHFLALIFNEQLYLKVDDQSRATFEAEGCQPFVYPMKDGSQASLNYMTSPEEAMESPHGMLPWARLALAAALRAAAAKRPARKAAAKKTSAKRAVKAASKTPRTTR